jgi:hypothetical protein
VTRKGTTIEMEWDVNDPKDVKEANEYYDNLTKQGWIAVVEKETLHRILEFKKDEGRILFLPVLEGG